MTSPPKSPQIVVLGSVNTDLVIRGPRLPAPGETVLGGEFYQAHGGKGANQAVAAARAAARPVLLIAAVGDDAFGRQSLEQFHRENLDLRFVKTVPGQPSGVALILVDQQGENAISVASGANAHLTPEDVDAVPEEVLAGAKVFLTCLELPTETVARGLARASGAGLVAILNPAPANQAICRPDVLRQVDVMTPNEGEAVALVGAQVGGEAVRSARIHAGTQVAIAGARVGGEAGAVAAARRLQEMGCRRVVVTLGAAGSVVVEGDDAVHLPSHSVQPVDTTGAGDAFNGALAVALAEGRPLVDAARWASRAAAIAVTRPGAQPSMPTRAEIEASGRVAG